MAPPAEKPLIPFANISRAVRDASYPADAVAVMGILRGGLVPASLVAHQLGLPLFFTRIVYRNDKNEPQSEAPRWIGEHPRWIPREGRLLLVDDVAVTGSTLAEALRQLAQERVTTIVLKGKADLVLMPELPAGCVRWPWSVEALETG